MTGLAVWLVALLIWALLDPKSFGGWLGRIRAAMRATRAAPSKYRRRRGAPATHDRSGG